MLKKSVAVITIAMFLCAGPGLCKSIFDDSKDEVKVLKEGEETKAVPVHNFTCPVSGDEIKEATATRVEYKGKVYNLCCPACVKHFKKFPDKFAQMAESPR